MNGLRHALAALAVLGVLWGVAATADPTPSGLILAQSSAAFLD